MAAIYRCPFSVETGSHFAQMEILFSVAQAALKIQTKSTNESEISSY
jgi:hypothetical protein